MISLRWKNVLNVFCLFATMFVSTTTGQINSEKEVYGFSESLVSHSAFDSNFERVLDSSINNYGYSLKINKFAEYDNDYFKTHYQGFKPKTLIQNKNWIASSVIPPSTLDWRNSSLVNPIKDQEQCGSCWSFSAIGALEGQVIKKLGGKPASLSEQEMVDCVVDVKQPNSSEVCCDGCSGGGDVFSVSISV